MEFYAAMKKNEILLFAGKWMELENIILSEGSLALALYAHMNKKRVHAFLIKQFACLL
jgi:hypothetical protein